MDDVRQSLGQLMPVVEGYVKVERPDAISTNQLQHDSSRNLDIYTTKRRPSPRHELYRRYL